MQSTDPTPPDTRSLGNTATPPLVLLDRDGVINQEPRGSYITTASEWIPIPGSLEAIGRLTRAGFRVVILSNQSAVGRGVLELSDLDAIHSQLRGAVERAGGHVSGIFYCPHHPEEGCECRKPAPGLIHRAEAVLGFSARGAPMVGDQLSDVLAARRAGCRPVLVRTGRGGEISLDHTELAGVPVYGDLAEAANAILAEFRPDPDSRPPVDPRAFP